jgi:hypothetical protein
MICKVNWDFHVEVWVLLARKLKQTPAPKVGTGTFAVCGRSARILGQEEGLRRVRAGFAADLIVVNGNPLENLKVLYPAARPGGVEWTVKDGIPYHAPSLMERVKQIAAQARASAGR